MCWCLTVFDISDPGSHSHTLLVLLSSAAAATAKSDIRYHMGIIHSASPPSPSSCPPQRPPPQARQMVILLYLHCIPCGHCGRCTQYDWGTFWFSTQVLGCPPALLPSALPLARVCPDHAHHSCTSQLLHTSIFEWSTLLH